jgi:hypothetical protein
MADAATIQPRAAISTSKARRAGDAVHVNARGRLWHGRPV